MKKRNQFIPLPALALSTLMALSACGPQGFVPASIRSHQTAAGSTLIPAKVDIVFGVSQNLAMLNIAPGLQNEIPQFLQNLQNSGWDYRFVGIPLGDAQINTPALFPITNKVSVSQYDTNTPVASWLAPFPGALYTDPSLKMLPSLLASAFTYPQPTVASTSAVYGRESGLRNQVEFLSRSDVNTGNGQTGFLRPDAALAVISLSNGDDRSYGTWYWNSTFQRTMWAPAAQTTYDNALNTLRGLKTSASSVKYYSVVSHLTTNCRGYGTWSGIRYEDYANQMNGRTVDLCSVPVSSALSTIAEDIQGTPLPYRRNFLVLDSEPQESTLRVIRYANGDTSNPVEIPNDATNGWTYSGYLTNQYTIDSPISMDQRTGYMVELHGTARLNGADSADVLYQAIGNPTAQ
jgi:hypothetical protein